MNFIWYDYNPNTMSFVENWLDKKAIHSTGLDEGFRAFYEYWSRENGFIPGENFWCKVTFENDKPFAVIAFCQHEHRIIIMEVLVAPEKRGQGKGTALLRELLKSKEIVGFKIQHSEAVIYPDNVASQKAFENAGFICHNNHTDENGTSLHYIYENKPISALHLHSSQTKPTD